MFSFFVHIMSALATHSHWMVHTISNYPPNHVHNYLLSLPFTQNAYLLQSIYIAMVSYCPVKMTDLTYRHCQMSTVLCCIVQKISTNHASLFWNVWSQLATL